MTIGYKASAEQFGPRALVEYAVRAEDAGLDSVWVPDHFLPWRHHGGHAPSALAWIAAVGERAPRDHRHQRAHPHVPLQPRRRRRRSPRCRC
jgi:coenzyme F420-dependent glucose-6-phosphate dehydrogenase